MLDVRLDGLLADEEIARDLGLVAAARQERQHLVLTRRQLGRRRDERRVRLDRRGSKKPLHARQHLLRVERLQNVVVGAEQEPARRVERIDALSRHEDDRKLLPEQAAEVAEDRVAGDAGQADVEQDERRALRASRRQGFLPRRRLPHAATGRLEDARDQRPHVSVVVDDEYRAAVNLSLPCRSESPLDVAENERTFKAWL